MTRDELINAIDSPIVQALARVFDTPPQRMAKSFSEQIVEILAPKLINVPAQRPPSEIERLRDALGQIASKNDLSGVSDDDLESAARNALYECELIARSALSSTECGEGK